MENSFSELRSKLVINLTDGKKLGHSIDIIFEQSTAKILGVIIPENRNFFLFLKQKKIYLFLITAFAKLEKTQF